MTNEELLYPRFKLISDFMGNSRPVGSVSVEIATANYFRKFPANFKELKWSDERDVKDLPLYLKTIHTGFAFKVHGYAIKVHSYDLDNDSIYIEVNKTVYIRSLMEYISKRVPATEAEYLAGLNKQP